MVKVGKDTALSAARSRPGLNNIIIRCKDLTETFLSPSLQVTLQESKDFSHTSTGLLTLEFNFFCQLMECTSKKCSTMSSKAVSELHIHKLVLYQCSSLMSLPTSSPGAITRGETQSAWPIKSIN